MSNELTNWFDGFMKVAEAAGITDPTAVQKLIVFHKRAELAAKFPKQFEDGFAGTVKSAQMYNPFSPPQFNPSMNPLNPGLYSTPSGNFAATDVTPDVGHHALIGGAGGMAAGGLIGGILRKITGNLGPLATKINTGELGPAGAAVGRFVSGLAKHPHGGNLGMLGLLAGGLYGAGKGHFMTGRYGAGSQVGMTPEGYFNRLDPEISRMKELRSRLYGSFGPERMSSNAWYQQNQPQMSPYRQ